MGATSNVSVDMEQLSSGSEATNASSPLSLFVTQSRPHNVLRLLTVPRQLSSSLFL